MLFLLLIDSLTPHMHLDDTVEGPKANIKKTTMLVLAVVIHNIPEMSEGGHTNKTTIAFMVGFAGMMLLDVIIG